MKWCLIFLLGFLLAQEKTEPQPEEALGMMGDWVELEMPYQKQNVTVPRELLRVIRELLELDGVDEQVIESYAIYPANISVEISQEDVSVTKDNKNYRVTYPEGGGEIDLFQYVDGKGKFYVRLSPHLLDDQKFHLLYLSESPGRLFGDVKWGNGCGNIYELTASAGKFFSNRGMLVTTSKRHYLHLMAGLYVMFQLVEDKMLLGYIRIKDTRYPQFTCSI